MKHVTFFCIAVILSAIDCGQAFAAPMDEELRRELFRAHYYRIIREAPERWVQHNIALIDPKRAADVVAARTFEENSRLLLSVLPNVSVGGNLGVSALSVGYDVDLAGTLTSFAAHLGTGPFGLSRTRQDFREWAGEQAHSDWRRVDATADAIWDVLNRGGKADVASGWSEGDLKNFQSMLAVDAQAFQLPRSGVTTEQLLATAPVSLSSIAALLNDKARGQISADELQKLATEARVDRSQLADQLKALAGPVSEVQDFVQKAKSREERAHLVSEAHAGIGLFSTLLSASDPAAAKRFAEVGHSTVNAVSAISQMATSTVTLGGIGAVVGALSVFASSGASESGYEALQGVILDMWKAMNEQFAAVRRGITDLRTTVLALGMQMEDAFSRARVDYAKLAMDVQEIRVKLDALSFFVVDAARDQTIDPAERAWVYMRDRLDDADRAQFLSNVGDVQHPLNNTARQELSAVVKLGTVDSRQPTFAKPTSPYVWPALDEAHDPLEDQVGNLPLLARSLSLSGQHARALDHVPHPRALLLATSWYLDVTDRLGDSLDARGGTAQLCSAWKDVERAASSLRDARRTAVGQYLDSASRVVEESGRVWSKGVAPLGLDSVALRARSVAERPAETADERYRQAVRAGVAPHHLYVVEGFGDTPRRLSDDEIRTLPYRIFRFAPKGVATFRGCAVVVATTEANPPRNELGFAKAEWAKSVTLGDVREVCFTHDAIGAPMSETAELIVREARTNWTSLRKLEDPRLRVDRDAWNRRIYDALRWRYVDQVVARVTHSSLLTANHRAVAEPRVETVYSQIPNLPPTLALRGCWVIDEEEKWSDDARGTLRTLDDEVVWVTSRRSICVPDGIPTLNVGEAYRLCGHSLRAQQAWGRCTDVKTEPTRGLEDSESRAERMESVYLAAQDRIVANLHKEWLTQMADQDSALRKWVDDLAIRRYHLNLINNFALGGCSKEDDVFWRATAFANGDGAEHGPRGVPLDVALRRPDIAVIDGATADLHHAISQIRVRERMEQLRSPSVLLQDCGTSAYFAARALFAAYPTAECGLGGAAR